MLTFSLLGSDTVSSLFLHVTYITRPLVSAALSQPVSLSAPSPGRWQHHIHPPSLTNINGRERFLPLIHLLACCQNGASECDNPGRAETSAHMREGFCIWVVKEQVRQSDMIGRIKEMCLRQG